MELVSKVKYRFSIKNFLLLVVILTCIIALIIRPQKYMQSARIALVVFGNNVLPALFPFFFFTKILTAIGLANSMGELLKKPMQLLYNSPPISGYVFFMSLISGYPVSAKILADLYEQNILSHDEVKRIMSYTSISGPIFIIGTVATSILNSPKVGYIILASHVLAAILNGLIYRGKKSANNESRLKFCPLNTDNILNSAISSSVGSILCVGGFIIIFYIIADILSDLGIIKIVSNFLYFLFKWTGVDRQIFNGISLSLVEMTRGILEIGKIADLRVVTIAITSIISLGGASIMAQSMAYLSKAKIKVSSYILTKFTHFLLSIIISTILATIFIKV